MTLHVLPRSYLRTDGDRAWFGPADAPLLVLNSADAAGVQWWADEPDGWAAPSASTPIDSRSYGDGGYAGQTTFEARVLSWGTPQTCVTAAPDRRAAQVAWRQLVGVLQSRSPVLYTQDDYPAAASLLLRASGQPKIRWVSDRAFEWAAVMVAEDPFKFDAAQLAQPLSVGLPQIVGGYKYNLRYNLIYGATTSGAGAVQVTNSGDEFSQAVYRIKGPFDHPTVLVGATGAYFTINRVGGALDTVIVDTRAGTVTLNGTSILDDLDGGFPLIPPGESTVQWSHRGVYNAAARLTVTTTSTRK